MKLVSTILSLAALFSVTPASAQALSKPTLMTAIFIPSYSTPDTPLNGLGCNFFLAGNPTNPTIGNLSAYPNIGSIPGLGCGSCVNLTYQESTAFITIISPKPAPGLVSGDDSVVETSQVVMQILQDGRGDDQELANEIQNVTVTNVPTTYCSY